jgi:carboxyl-terminal processing protease
MDGVRSDVVLPSMMDALEMGEAFLDHPLPHDRIRRAPDFKPLDAQLLFIPRLKELSQERVNECRDFSYVIQDIMKTKSRLEANKLTLNKAEREKELAESDAQQKQRNTERRARFAKMAAEDKSRMRFYKITLEDLEKGSDLRPYDPSDETGSYMRRAKDETEELDETPKWPTGLDPMKRESLHVLRDLVDLTENARMVGIAK